MTWSGLFDRTSRGMKGFLGLKAVGGEPCQGFDNSLVMADGAFRACADLHEKKKKAAVVCCVCVGFACPTALESARDRKSRPLFSPLWLSAGGGPRVRPRKPCEDASLPVGVLLLPVFVWFVFARISRIPLIIHPTEGLLPFSFCPLFFRNVFRQPATRQRLGHFSPVPLSSVSRPPCPETTGGREFRDKIGHQTEQPEILPAMLSTRPRTMAQ